MDNKLVTLSTIQNRIREKKSVIIPKKMLKSFIENTLGYEVQHAGGVKGYDHSVFNALTPRLNELIDNYRSMVTKRAQKPRKAPKTEPIGMDSDWEMYNGEPYRVDYPWEIEDSYIHECIMEEVEKLILKEGRYDTLY